MLEITDKTPVEEVAQRIYEARRQWRSNASHCTKMNCPCNGSGMWLTYDNTIELTRVYMDLLVEEYGWSVYEARYSERSEAIYNHIEGINDGIMEAQRGPDEARQMGDSDRYGN